MEKACGNSCCKSFDSTKECNCSIWGHVLELDCEDYYEDDTNAIDKVTETILSKDSTEFSSMIEKHKSGKYFSTLKDILV